MKFTQRFCETHIGFMNGRIYYHHFRGAKSHKNVRNFGYEVDKWVGY